MLKKYEKLFLFYFHATLYFGKKNGFSKERKNKEVAIYCVPT